MSKRAQILNESYDILDAYSLRERMIRYRNAFLASASMLRERLSFLTSSLY